MIISLITVTYNSGSTLFSTFQSILSQTYPDIEYIVIDGASNDGTVSVIQEFEPLFKGKLKWISEPDNGLYDAINKGLYMAIGEVVGILNSDDFFTKSDILEQVAQAFEMDNKLDAVYGDVHFVNSTDLTRPIRYYSSKIFKPSLMKLGFMPAHPTFYCRKSCYEKYGLYKTDFKIAADFDLLLRFIYVHHISLKYLPLDMVTMRVGGASTNGLKSHVCIMKEHLRSFKENGLKSNFFLLFLRYFYKLTEYIRK